MLGSVRGKKGGVKWTTNEALRSEHGRIQEGSKGSEDTLPGILRNEIFFVHTWGLVHIIWFNLIKERINWSLLWSTGATCQKPLLSPTNTGQIVIEKSVILITHLFCAVSLSTDSPHYIYFIYLFILSRTFSLPWLITLLQWYVYISC